MSRLQDSARQIVRSNETIADSFYQRKTGARQMLPNVLKQLVLLTELLVQDGKIASDPEFPQKMKTWNEKFTMLSEAIQGDDDILIADILHHEIDSYLEGWVI